MTTQPSFAIEPPPPAPGVPEWPGPPLGAGNWMLAQRQPASRLVMSDHQLQTLSAAHPMPAECFRLGTHTLALHTRSAHLGRLARFVLEPAQPGSPHLRLDIIAGGSAQRFQGRAHAILQGTLLARDFFAALQELAPDSQLNLRVRCLNTATISASPTDLPRWLDSLFENVGDVGARAIAAHQAEVRHLLDALFAANDPTIREWLLGFETSELEELCARLVSSPDGRVVVRCGS